MTELSNKSVLGEVFNSNLVKGIKYNLEKKRFRRDWEKLMVCSKKYNSNYETFKIAGETKTSYGWNFRLYAPFGMAFSDLAGLKPLIESGLGGTFLYEAGNVNKYASCKIIYESLVKCNEIPFTPVNIKPYEICPGVDLIGNPIIINTNASQNVLIAGQCRKGKNGALDSIILNWINSCNENEVQLYLFQCSKVDLVKYSKCRQVKCYVSDNYAKMLAEMKTIDTEMSRRTALLNNLVEQHKGESIYDYNKINASNKLSYIYMVIDETLSLSDQYDDSTIKTEILGYIQKIAQLGPKVGIQYVMTHQRPDKELLPTFIKNMSSVRVCFGYADADYGKIMLGEENGELVHHLKARRAYISNNGRLDLLYTTNLRGRQDMYIKQHEVESESSLSSKE